MRIRNTFIGQSLEVAGQAPLTRTTVSSRPSRSADDDGDHVAAPKSSASLHWRSKSRRCVKTVWTTRRTAWRAESI